MTEPIIEVKDLTKHFVIEHNFWGKPRVVLPAVRKVNFSLQPGETVGLVGESGCGKSTIGRMLVGLYPPTAGKIYYQGQAKKHITKQVQMVFQDPYASLNPRMTVGAIIEEPMIIHGLQGKLAARQQRVHELLYMVGLKPEHANRFPHEFSGGQRQRVGIARALATQPQVIVCDEPISALDVSIQAQIVNLLSKLQKELGLTYLFIAHDLAMIKYISKEVLVMYMGSIVESGPAEQLYQQPLHPYTQALLSAIPIPAPNQSFVKTRVHLQGEVPNPLALPRGCSFSTRCPLAKTICHEESPNMITKGNRTVTCHLY